MQAHLPLAGVHVDAARLPPAEGAWLTWWGLGWVDDPRDLRTLDAFADDPAALAVCLSQSLAWCRGLASRGHAWAAPQLAALKRAVLHVERCGMRPPVEGGTVREDGLPVRGPTRPRCLVPAGVGDAEWAACALAWSSRVWWIDEARAWRVEVG